MAPTAPFAMTRTNVGKDSGCFTTIDPTIALPPYKVVPPPNVIFVGL